MPIARLLAGLLFITASLLQAQPPNVQPGRSSEHPKEHTPDEILAALHLKDVPGGEIELGTLSAKFMSLVDNTGLFENTNSADIAIEGTITVETPFRISDKSIPARLYHEFLMTVPFETALTYCVQVRRAAIRINPRKSSITINAGSEDLPVDTATFIGAVAFCQWLSEKTGETVRLPTEAEWMVAEVHLNWNGRMPDGEDPVGNWTSDYFIEGLEHLTKHPDPTGPDQEIFADDQPLRVLRFIRSSGYRVRTGDPESDPLPARAYGFRVVAECED